VDRQYQSRWRPSRRQVRWASGIVAISVVFILIGYRYGITLWDWLELLIVPAVIAAGGLWFNKQQRERELETADRRARDEALQAYFNQMSQLLLDDAWLKGEGEDRIRALARAHTLTALARAGADLRGVAPERKRSIVRFLLETELLENKQGLLSNSDLSGANLFGLPMEGVRLYLAYLRDAVLARSDLRNTDLQHTDLTGADLSAANLTQANLREANLVQAKLNKANLREADLSEADLSEADLSEAVLDGAKLDKALVADAQLDAARSLEGATMPNGQEYEVWLKSKGRGEDGENSGP
jgi:uncharacterized protein YjbI with pentapeptide repeats